VGQNGQCFLLRFVRTESDVQVNPAKKGRRQAAARYVACKNQQQLCIVYYKRYMFFNQTTLIVLLIFLAFIIGILILIFKINRIARIVLFAIFTLILIPVFLFYITNRIRIDKKEWTIAGLYALNMKKSKMGTYKDSIQFDTLKLILENNNFFVFNMNVPFLCGQKGNWFYSSDGEVSYGTMIFQNNRKSQFGGDSKLKNLTMTFPRSKYGKKQVEELFFDKIE
jgi:hypothetical protein